MIYENRFGCLAQCYNIARSACVCDAYLDTQLVCKNWEPHNPPAIGGGAADPEGGGPGAKGIPSLDGP